MLQCNLEIAKDQFRNIWFRLGVIRTYVYIHTHRLTIRVRSGWAKHSIWRWAGTCATKSPINKPKLKETPVSKRFKEEDIALKKAINCLEKTANRSEQKKDIDDKFGEYIYVQLRMSLVNDSKFSIRVNWTLTHLEVRFALPCRNVFI